MLTVYDKNGITVTVGPLGDVTVKVEDAVQTHLGDDGGVVFAPNIPELAWAEPTSDDFSLLEKLMGVVVAAHPGTDLRTSGGSGSRTRLSVYGPLSARNGVQALATRLMACLEVK